MNWQSSAAKDLLAKFDADRQAAIASKDSKSSGEEKNNNMAPTDGFTTGSTTANNKSDGASTPRTATTQGGSMNNTMNNTPGGPPGYSSPNRNAISPNPPGSSTLNFKMSETI
jgi:hypothetical protein